MTIALSLVAKINTTWKNNCGTGDMCTFEYSCVSPHSLHQDLLMSARSSSETAYPAGGKITLGQYLTPDTPVRVKYLDILSCVTCCEQGKGKQQGSSFWVTVMCNVGE